MTTLGAWLHTFNPLLWRIHGELGVRWYGVAYLTGFLIAFVLLTRFARRGVFAVPPPRIADAMMWLVGGVIVGGRLGYVLIYDRALLAAFTAAPPFWGVFAIHVGGMASHGGIAGVVLAAWRVSRGWKDDTAPGGVAGRTSIMHVLDGLALVTPFGLGLGRIANFVNGELLGRIVTPPGVEGPWWTVQFPQELREWKSSGGHGGLAPELSAEQQEQLRGLIASVRLPADDYPAQGISRLIENAKAHAAGLKPLLSSRHPSQLYQFLAEGVVLGAVLWIAAARPRKPGVIGALFILVYGVLRVVTEVWRLPDAQFQDGRPWGLSRGQWLSVPMVLFGGAMAVWTSRRPVGKIGPWWGAGGPPEHQVPDAADPGARYGAACRVGEDGVEAV